MLLIDFKKTYPICISGNYAGPPEDCGGAMSFMKLKDYYSVWRIEKKTLEALEEYKVEKDKNLLRENIESLHYWVNLYKFDRKKINHQLCRYFNNKNDNQLTIEEIQDED